MQRNLINLVVAIVLLPATVLLVLRMMPGTPQSEVGFPNHNHRVAVALDEVMQAECTSVTHGPVTLSQNFQASSTNGNSGSGQSRIQEDLPYFWLTVPPGKTPELWSLDSFSIEGKARDGRTISVSIADDLLGMGTGCVLDFHGDAEAARIFSGKITERLAHPKFKQESAEDRASLTAFFQPKLAPGQSFTLNQPFKGTVVQPFDGSVVPASISPTSAPGPLDPKDAVR